MTTTQGAIRRLELLLARTPDMECADDLRVVLADAVLSRRLLDDARAQKPVEWKVENGCGTTRRFSGYEATASHRAEGWTVTPLYAAAPVPAQPAADVAAIAKAVRDIPSRLESLGGQRFAYVKLSEVIETIYSVSAKHPAAVPEAVASLIPKGWVFYSADASIQSSDPRRPMAAMIKRDVDGVQWWLQLTEEEKEAAPLYSSGTGMTLTLAIQNAVEALLSAADTEVKNG